MKTESKESPTVQWLQGVCIVPVNITTKTNEEGEISYDWDRIDLPANSVNRQKTNEQLQAEANKIYAKTQQTETLTAGCPTSLGFRIDCMDNNVADFNKTLGLLSIYPAMTEIIVRDYDNVNHTITVNQYKTMCIELGAHVTTIRQTYWSKIDNI